MAVACCDRWAAAGDRVALIHEAPAGPARRYTFRDLQRASKRVANLLMGLGLSRGDRVLLLLGQRPETAMLHLGTWRAGIISVPCSVLFDAARFNANARALTRRLIEQMPPDLARRITIDNAARLYRLQTAR